MDKSPIINEKELLHKLRDGNRTAFKFLYNKYYSILYLHAYSKLRDREAAKDIVHDMFAVIWQKRETLQITTSLSSYLYASVRNRVIDYISKERSKSNYLASLSDCSERDNISTDHLIREKMLREQIERALDQLSPRLREIFELSRNEHLSHKEISEKLNLSEQSVRSYIRNALRVLRVKLNAFVWVLLIISYKLF